MRARLRRLPATLASALISVYRYGISPVIGPRCRFWPSCSEYGQQALRRHGFVRGLWLTAARVSRCHPWNPGGVDPLPETFEPPAAARYLGRALRAARPAAAPCGCEPSRIACADAPNPTPRR